jgi:Flp pilus assembly protein TadB
MPEPPVLVAALLAGASATVGVATLAWPPGVPESAAWLDQRPVGRSASSAWLRGLIGGSPAGRGALERLELQLARAGLSETPERAVALALAAAGSGSLLAGGLALPASGAAGAIEWGLLTGVAVPLAGLLLLARRARRRRVRLAAELAPLLELLGLELSAGGSATSALAAVLSRVHGELAEELRRAVVASQVIGGPPLEARLGALATRLDLPVLAGLASLIGASREYGSGVSAGVRALAADLRRAQRRSLIEASRRSLNRVLVPCAAGVLLPFMAILLYPAVVALTRSLR